MTHCRLLYITTATQEEAKRIATTLVEERLVACVNILGPIHSFYRWNDSLQEDTEVALIAKTVASRVDETIARVQALHGYDCPCIIALPIQEGAPAFLDWITTHTSA